MTEPLPPVRRQVVVNVDAERAFEAWTAELGTWWPFAGHSVCGEGATAAFTDGRLVETGPDGSQHLWGTVTDWEPGRCLRMTWHPGHVGADATTVDVRFDGIGDNRTLVTLTHTGWENRADAKSARENYRSGWVGVVSTFGETAVAETSTVDAEATTWLVLEHTVDSPGAATVFADPRFAEHIAFLRRVHDRGWLVAAGNLPDSPGAGMTILHVPDTEVAKAVAAAQDEDLSVVGGLFGVRVRPWNVALSVLS